MKTFMEEYGKVIVVAIIVVALIVIALVFKTSGSESINGIWKDFMTKSELGLSIDKSKEGKSFSVAGYGKFSYEEGMTWGEWVNSSYNTRGFVVCEDCISYISDPIITEVDNEFKESFGFSNNVPSGTKYNKIPHADICTERDCVAVNDVIDPSIASYFTNPWEDGFFTTPDGTIFHDLTEVPDNWWL